METKASLLSLQNGSDVRGVALALEDGPPVNLTEEAANRIAGAFGSWLSARTKKPLSGMRIGVGHDSRFTAAPLKAAIAGGLAALGIQVFDCGLASTPAMFMGTVFPEAAFDGSIMITASHLPKNRNGMKFFTRDGGLEKEDIRALLELAEKMEPAGEAANPESFPLIKHYAAFLREKIASSLGGGSKPLEGLRIAVDAGNGAGGFFVREVLEPLGADCAGSQFLDPDGNFPNHQPNPEDKGAMDSICRAVIGAKADLGIIFDTDVDRMSAVFSDGREVNRDAIIALMAAVLAPEYPGSTIVTDSVTSDRLTRFLEGKLGLRHHCFKRGYKNVINEAIRLNQEGVVSPLAIETSGHGALKENYFLDDGAYMAVRLIVAAAQAAKRGESLEALLDCFPPAGAAQECRLAISGEDFGAYGRKVLDAFEKRAQEEKLPLVKSYEGIRLSFPGEGWLLLRMSLHDPLMPLNLEGDTPKALQKLQQIAKRLLTGFDRLNLSSLD